MDPTPDLEASPAAAAPAPPGVPPAPPAADAAVVPRTAPVALPEGFRLEGYRIDGVLGQGPFGITYRATDVHLNVPVVIKEYLPEDLAFRQADSSVGPIASRVREAFHRGMEAFLVEARTLASLRHPAIVRVLRFFEENRTAYMVLEFEAGQSLRNWWPHQQALGEEGLAQRLAPLFDGIAVLHASGVLHRDIRPDNIQVRDEDGRFVLLDFRAPGQAVAVAGYAAPEQHERGELGPWTDLYAIGATLYWAVSGKKPPDAASRRAGTPMKSALEAGRGRYGDAFLRAIDAALRLDPARRPRDILELRRELFADHLTKIDGSGVGADGDTVIDGDRPLPKPPLRGGLRLAANPLTWPVTAKLVGGALLVALLPFVVAAAVGLAAGQQALARAEGRFVEQVAQGSAGRLAQFTAEGRRLARALATDHDLIVALASPDETGRLLVADKFVRLRDARPELGSLALLDARGTAAVATEAAEVGQRPVDAALLQPALQGRPPGAAWLPGGGGLLFVERVAGDDGSVLGAVALRLKPGALVAVLDEARRDAMLLPVLVDGRGTLLHHPQRDRVEQPLERHEPALAEALQGARAVGHSAGVRLADGREAVFGHAPVAGTDWRVGIADVQARAEAPLMRAAGWLLAGGVLLALVVGLAAWQFARGVVRPVRALTDAADAVKRGDYYHATVPVQRRDELGALARSFNVMIDVLRQRERERERHK